MKTYPIHAETVYFHVAVEYDGHCYTVVAIPNDPNLENRRVVRRFDDFQTAHKVFAGVHAELMRIEVASLENPADLKHVEWQIQRDFDALDDKVSPDPEISRLIAEQQAKS